MFLRGIADDYDAWGSADWSYESLLPLFREQERDLDYPDSPIHGGNGPIPVRRERPEDWLIHQQAFYEAVTRMGFREKADLADSEGEGIGPIPMNMFGGFRTSAAMGFLDPIRSAPTLSICSSTRVLKVLFERGRAVGVLAERDGRLIRIEGTEVVLCSSGFMTPHVLVHSGIGQAATLAKLEIPILVDLPGVGQNAHDHPAVAVEVLAPEKYLADENDPRFQTMLVMSSGHGGYRNDMHIFPAHLFGESLLFDACMQHATAVGYLDFKADIRERPCINFCYLQSEVDRARFREAVRLIIELLAQPSLQEIGRCRAEPTDDVLRDDHLLDQWIEESLGSAMHTSGTCRMGAADDADAVVDYRGRVKGVEGLRIADLSIAPDVIRAPANPTAIVIGQKVAQFMLAEMT
jgi:choline dehydrogenase